MKSRSSESARLDRLLVLSVFQPLAKLLPAERGLKIPILMYHSVASNVDDNLHPYFRTVTRPETFLRHVSILQEEGYQGVTLSEAVDVALGRLERCQRLGARKGTMSEVGDGGDRRLVVFTFDDGFRDFYETAFPILEQAGFRATVFLASTYIDRTFLTGRDCLRAREVKELAEKGVEFGSHTASHRRLRGLSKQEIAYELAVSKQMIERITEREVATFSYPYRFPQEDTAFKEEFGILLDEQGYRVGVTTAIGRFKSGDDLRFLPRLPINDCDDDQLLKAKLAGGYDWLHRAQVFYKRSRALWRTSDA